MPRPHQTRKFIAEDRVIAQRIVNDLGVETQ
jgi:hypothetical protein